MEVDVGGTAGRLTGETRGVVVLNVAGASVEQVEYRRLHNEYVP